MPDYDGERSEARDLGDQERLQRARDDLKRVVTGWLKRTGDKTDDNLKPQKRYRVSAKRWALDFDHQLQVSCDLDLRTFQQPEKPSDRGPGLHWPLASVAIDQGSDGHCAEQGLMRFMRINLDYWPDLSHGFGTTSRAR